MVLIEESINEAEARSSGSGAGAGAGTGAQKRIPTKRPKLYLVINRAYVYKKLEDKLAPWIQENEEGTMTVMMKELAEDLSARMHLAVPKLQYVEPQPAQMLRFTNLIPAEVFTNRLMVGEDNNPLQIELVDIESGKICEGALASSLEVEVFVTRGNFPSNDQKLRKCKALSPRNKATKPLFMQAISTKTAGKRLSRKKKFVVKLHNGKAVVKGKITDNSKWVRSGMFKLVARVTKRSYQGRRIKEALSEAFTVKESKLEGCRKHENPSPNDSTRRLINVGPKYHKILQDIGINTVQDLRNKLESDHDGLKKTLGMQNSKWEATVEHAKKCRVSEEEINLSNIRGNDMGDLVSPSLDNQPRNMEDASLIQMGVEEQMIPESKLSSDQMEGLPPNISLNRNDEISEGMGEDSIIHQNFGRLDSNRWIDDYYPNAEFIEGVDNHHLHFN